MKPVKQTTLLASLRFAPVRTDAVLAFCLVMASSGVTVAQAALIESDAGHHPEKNAPEAATNTPAAPTNTLVAPVMRLKTEEDASRLARELEFRPADARAWRLLGEYHFRRAEYREAVTNFSKSLALAPSDPLVLNDLAASLAMVGQLDGARRLLEAGLRNNPRNYSMRFNLACIAVKQNRRADATKLLLELEAMRWPLLQLHLADPDLDPLRSDAGFLAIQTRVQKLPAGTGLYERIEEPVPDVPAAVPAK